MTRTALYRHYDAEGELLYVGISANPTRRLSEHMKAAKWDISSVSLTWFDTQKDAENAERDLIRTKNPPHNIKISPKDVPTPPSEGWRGRLCRAIDKAGMSLRSVSLKAGCGAGYVHSVLIEGKDPTIERFLAICAAISVDPAKILGAQS